MRPVAVSLIVSWVVWLAALLVLAPRTAFAQESALPAPASAIPATERRVDTIREDVPRLAIPKRVAARHTPSGLAVPRWVSLKSPMRCRQGPSREHRELWRYEQGGLPLVVVAEAENWRRVRDVNGDQCWVYANGLSGARGVLVLEDVALRAKPHGGARVRARAGRGAVLRLEACRSGWCEVRAAGGLEGWALQKRLWGTQPL